jgi:hypothetical protein
MYYGLNAYLRKRKLCWCPWLKILNALHPVLLVGDDSSLSDTNERGKNLG